MGSSRYLRFDAKLSEFLNSRNERYGTADVGAKQTLARAVRISTTIPATIVSFNIVASIRGTVAAKR
jgi:hypothetical protein